MIPLPGIRDKGGGPQLGAKGARQRGPFGTWPDEGEVFPGSQKNPDDDQDDEEQETHRHGGGPSL